MNRRALSGPRLPKILWFFAASVLAISVIVSAIVYAIGSWQSHELALVHREFPGLARATAYARLRSMGFMGFALIGSGAVGDLNGGPDWPLGGDVAVRFPYVSRTGYGCGNEALAILRFKGDRLVAVGESVWEGSCL